MSLVLIADDMPILRELLAATMESAGHQIVCAANGREALEKLRAEPPALLLLDLWMPEVDGIAVLKAMRADPKTAEIPVILVTASGDRAHILQAAKYGVRDYLLKTQFTRAELLARVRKYLAPGGAVSPSEGGAAGGPWGAEATARAAVEDDCRVLRDAAEAAGVPLFTRPNMLQKIERAKFKSIPQPVTELISHASTPRAVTGDVAVILKRDPAFTARVLRICNAAPFAGAKGSIATADDAVKHLGAAVVQNLAIALGIAENFAAGQADDTFLARCWQHSLGVAGLMEKLTPPSDEAPAGIAYAVGLCHDLADIVLRQHFGVEYGCAMELAIHTGRAPWHAKSAVFGLPYHELVTVLLTRIGMPPIIMAPVQEFCERAFYRQPEGAGSVLARTLRVANVYAHGLMLAPGLYEPVAPLGKAECRTTFGAHVPPIDGLTLRDEALTTAGLIAGLSFSDSSKLCEPLLARRPHRICYVRDHEYTELDPLHSLLRITAEHVDVFPRMPTKRQELGAATALVIAARQAADAEEVQNDMDIIQRLLAGREIPVLYLGGPTAEKAQELPPEITVSKLPVPIQAVGKFLS